MHCVIRRYKIGDDYNDDNSNSPFRSACFSIGDEKNLSQTESKSNLLERCFFSIHKTESVLASGRVHYIF